MISVNEIRDHLASYVANEVHFDQFEDWLLAQSWNMHLDSSHEAQQLVHQIKSPIYEYLDGLINEPNLKRELLTLVKEQTADLIVSDTQAPIIRQTWGSRAVAQFAQAQVVG